MYEMTKLCKNCFRKDRCGNNKTTWCTGYAPYVETTWSDKILYYVPTVETKINDTWTEQPHKGGES